MKMSFANKVNVMLLALLLCFSPLYSQVKISSPNVDAVLYTGAGNNQPLVVGLGGSEGGNAWTSNHWKPTRDEFIARGYAFLAIGYFGMEGTPAALDRIAIDDVYNAIKQATAFKGVNGKKIIIVGGSRGGDLALLLGSNYKDISAVVALVASHVAFPANAGQFDHSAWTYQGKELPFVPVNEAAVPFLMKGDLRKTFEAMLTDTLAVRQAAIQVENINGPVLLLSATGDEICPSTPMANEIMKRLKEKGFKHKFEHKAMEGRHAEPLKHFAEIFDFLRRDLQD